MVKHNSLLYPNIAQLLYVTGGKLIAACRNNINVISILTYTDWDDWRERPTCS